MKLATVVERDIQRVGVTHQTAFSVKATAKAFKILSSGLYRDKILAIVRELSCNAFDSHKVAGRGDMPFDVHLPNSLEPFFSITDHGVGLSDDDVRTVCTTYFESTKTDNNDLIGALGLGMKAPFSYVDSYTLISRWQGERRTYVMHLSEDGCPVVTQLGDTVPTNEQNGVEISIPVANSMDFREFAARAEQVFQHFNPKPNVTGAKINHVTFPEVLRGDGWVLHDRVNQTAVALMGMVAYPISTGSLWDKDSSVGVYQLPLVVDFPMGSLDFTAGREELSYDHKVTIPALVARAKEIVADIQRQAESSFSTCKSEYEARKQYQVLSSSHAWHYAVSKAKGFQWQGKTISSQYFELHAKDFPNVRVRTLEYRSYGRGSVRDSVFHFDQTVSQQKVFMMAADPKIRVFIDDLPRGGVARVRHLVKTEQGDISYRVVSGLTPEMTETLEAALSGYPIERVSSLPKPPVVAGGKKAKVRLITSASLIAGDVSRSAAVETTVDLAAGGFYVITRGHEIDGPINRETFGDVMRAAIGTGIFKNDDDLHMVPITVSADFVDNEDWVDVSKFIREKTQNLVDAAAKSDLMAKAASADSFAQHSRNDALGLLRKLAPALSGDHAIKTLIETNTEYTKAKNEAALLLKLSAAFRIDHSTAQSTNDLVMMFDDINKKYPLLSLIKTYYIDNNDIDAIAHYIRVIDKA